MAQQITIDIIAETKKLREGVEVANQQLGSVDKSLKGLTATAFAAASAFALREGVTFLKQGIDEAKEAQETMRKAVTTFGEGSTALAKITADADKFGKALSVDNDEIIALSTQLGSRLPANVRFLSAELVNVGFDVEAFTGGVVSAEGFVAKLGKALIDGVLTIKELRTIFPNLTDLTYKQAEALSKQGKNQEALTLLIGQSQKAYGDAAEKNVTSTQKFDTALANLKEVIGEKLLPFVEKAINFFTNLLTTFSNQPAAIQNIIIGLTGIVAIGAPLLTFIANFKVALGLLIPIKAATATASTAVATGMTGVATTTGFATAALTALKFALISTGIGALVVGLGFLVAKFVESKSEGEKLANMFDQKLTPSYQALTAGINNTTGALNQYRLFSTQGANNLLNTNAANAALANLDLDGTTKTKAKTATGLSASDEKMRIEILKTLAETQVTLNAIQNPEQTRENAIINQRAREENIYNINVSTLRADAEAGKVIVESIKEFADRGGRTGAFFAR